MMMKALDRDDLVQEEKGSLYKRSIAFICRSTTALRQCWLAGLSQIGGDHGTADRLRGRVG